MEQLAQSQSAGEKVRRYRLLIKGIVQGVGFRPFVYNLAQAKGIKGSVCNSGRGVIIEAEGPETRLKEFCTSLQAQPPRLARISSFTWEELPPCGYREFIILKSEEAEEREALIPPDVGLCPACARETFDASDRHYLYPFTNCTNCGPRFTIIREVPYDRKQTSMANFPMCKDCAREYHDVSDRRFHAQPVACPVCGPQVEMVDKEGKIIFGDWQRVCWEALAAGKILALKSLGGFHLVCDAQNEEAVRELRRRKGRSAKPLAVMVRDLTTARKYCLVNAQEANLLSSPQAPIVVLKKRPGFKLPEALAPGLKTLGVMLPYTPLHFLLFAGPFEILVMTSGNYAELPLAKDNAKALVELKNMADLFLRHNREIVNRCDDSLTAIVDGEVQLFRRSRGYVPRPLSVPTEGNHPVVLGMGGEMKNTFCLLKKDAAILSQHIGELETAEGEENLVQSLFNFKRLLGVEPEIVGYDLHPGYRSSRLALNLPLKVKIGIQHHHAHLAACLADNNLDEKVIGVILDGTGYGLDGSLWGFEILTGDYLDFSREYHLAYFPLPGGEQAIRKPWRLAVAYLTSCLKAKGEAKAKELFGGKGKEFEITQRLLSTGFNSPLTSGCGRFFDAVSALLGVCQESTYEGQAAIELGELALEPAEGILLPSYPFTLQRGIIFPGETIAEILADQEDGVPREIIATKFHNTVVAMVVEAVKEVATKKGLKKVVLSGGSWQNRYLFTVARKVLREANFTVYFHRQVPANDGGLALGQALIAYRRWRECA